MAVLAFLTAQLAIVGVFSVAPPGLRGSELASAPAAASSGSPAFVDERGERGHFYYADSCDDCVYKQPLCGCRPAVEYLACLTKHCHSSNHSKFAKKCEAFESQCSSEIDVDCLGSRTVCFSRYNQLPSGGIGLTLDLNGTEDDAFCGPHGKCIGTIHMKANVHNAHMISLQAPAPAAVSGLLPPGAPAPAAPTSSVSLECGVPKVEKADIDNPAQWTTCKVPVLGDKAGCDLPMFSTLNAGKGKESYCVLTEAAGNPPKRLTQPAWHLIKNMHEKPQNDQVQTVEPPGVSGSSALPWMQKKD